MSLLFRMKAEVRLLRRFVCDLLVLDAEQGQPWLLTGPGPLIEVLTYSGHCSAGPGLASSRI